MRDPTGRSRCFGFVSFADPVVVDIVLQKTHILDKKQVSRGYSIDQQHPAPQVASHTSTKMGVGKEENKVFVGGIHIEADEKDLKEIFEQFGDVCETILMRDRESGRSRGFGFVTFTTYEGAQKACNDADLRIRGRRVEVKLAVPKGRTVSTKSDASNNGSDPYAAWTEYFKQYPEYYEAMMKAYSNPATMAAYYSQYYGSSQSGGVPPMPASGAYDPTQYAALMAAMGGQMNGGYNDGTSSTTSALTERLRWKSPIIRLTEHLRRESRIIRLNPHAMTADMGIPDAPGVVRADPDHGQGRQEVRVAVLAENATVSGDETATMTAENMGNTSPNLPKTPACQVLLICTNSNTHAGQPHQAKLHHMEATLIDRLSITMIYRDHLNIQCAPIIPMDDPRIAIDEGFWDTGKLLRQDSTLVADKRRGYVVVEKDGMLHFRWFERSASSPEDVKEVEFLSIPQCPTGKAFAVKFRTSSIRLYFWLQEPKHEDYGPEFVKKMNRILLNKKPAVAPSAELSASSNPSDAIQKAINSGSGDKVFVLSS
ncbi:Hrp1p [Paramicrosporidium saccamoebae]|uniref:Hrp1p n=1 Tax=Paramicrosporidium saccamoebae TaxID=1246581 RepID=A0A2H9TQ09_9FUNG|nr:Hrp1p [Paramicrosporidium saccamoebae]